MSMLSKVATKTLLKLRKYCSISASSILSENPSTILTTKDKSGSDLSVLIKSENNPEKILNICRVAPLNPESYLDRIAFSNAISKLAYSKYFDGIRVLLEELKDRPDLRNERFLSLSIVLYGQAGMIHNGITTFEQMEQMGIHRTVKSLNSLLLACTQAKKYDEVKRIFTEFPTMYNIEPDIDSYNTAIKAFCAVGESSSGYSIIAEMGRKGCKPNVITFANLISGFYKEEKFEDVGKVLTLMEEHGMKPGLHMYNVRIKSLCKLDRSFEAEALLDDMLEKDIKPNTKTYSSLIYGFCKEGKFEDAKRLFKNMSKHGCIPDSNCYYTLISFLCEGGDYEKALQLCKKSMKKNWFPNLKTMKSLVEGLVSVSMVEEAKELVKEVKEKFPKNADLWKDTEEKLTKFPLHLPKEMERSISSLRRVF